MKKLKELSLKIFNKPAYFWASLSVALLSCAFVALNVSACALPTDNITLFENGNRITDNSVFAEVLPDSDRSNTTFEYCLNGQCTLGPWLDANFYKLDNGIKVESPPASSANSSSYYKNLEKSTLYKYEYRHDKSYNGSCGVTRNFNLDLRTGKSTRPLAAETNSSVNYLLFSILGIFAVAAIVLIVYAARSYLKGKRK